MPLSFYFQLIKKIICFISCIFELSEPILDGFILPLLLLSVMKNSLDSGEGALLSSALKPPAVANSPRSKEFKLVKIVLARAETNASAIWDH